MKNAEQPPIMCKADVLIMSGNIKMMFDTLLVALSQLKVADNEIVIEQFLDFQQHNFNC
jgi:hypothetical protein